MLGKTKGVPLFQEQAMKLAMVAADFTPGELNELRKAMATFKRRGTIGRLEQKMIARMVERGYERGFAERCFNQIKGFGEYGFPESHAASFAHLVYVSAWIKCHYPAAFAAGPSIRSRWDSTRRRRSCAMPRSMGSRSTRPTSIAATSMQPSPAQGLSRCCSWACGRWTGSRRRMGGWWRHDAATGPMTRSRRSGSGPALRSIRSSGWRRPTPRSLGIDRRQALWQAKALSRAKPLPLFAAQGIEGQGSEGPVTLPEMPLAEQVVNDYQTLKLSLKGT